MDVQPPPLPIEEISAGAGFWIRALARIIDIIFGGVLGRFAGVFGAVALATLQGAGAVSAGWEHRGRGINVTAIGVSLLGGFLYHCFSEGIHGASLGKLVCRLVVLQQDGRPSKMKGAIIRSLGWYIDALFFGLIGYSSMQKSPLNQRYGDVWGRTVVVKAKDVPVGCGRSALRFLLGLFLGAGFWTMLLVLGLILAKAPERDPKSALDYARRADAYNQRGQWDEAIADCTKALGLDPKLVTAYSNRGFAYWGKEEYDKAIEDYDRLIQLRPDNATYYYARGMVYYHKEEYDKAWDDVHKAQSLGQQIHPGFINNLREASGRER